MGDLRGWSPEPNGAVLEERPSSPSSPPRSASNQTVFSSEFWDRAEEATRGIIAQVQPTVVSEQRRKAVIDYVQRLIKTTLGCEVYPFGSVPLKTYLPDGDIDLTAFGALNVEEALANDVCSVLEREDENGAAKFVVKDVQLIRAEVKLVKCLVQNIVVDISFNQLGGLCTLCFLEKVDRLIGKDHLFKRSIILIKAWCYYESRILGAYHGLISTYALETLVLYIFHLFHSSLDGPLAVLYKFLDYFSKFDWDNYCISLTGPVRLSSLPEVVFETPENGGKDLLLTNDFLKECLEMYSVPSRGYETTSRTFPTKHLNIVDPLKENNNLGRSVSKGNFYRIKSAFTYGARKLGLLLFESEENIASEICKFFSNTLDRHGSGQRPDVQDPVPVIRYNGYGAISPVSVTDSCQEGQPVYELESANSTGDTGNARSNCEGPTNNLKISRFQTDPAVSENRFVGDAKDLATIRIQRLSISDEAPKSSTTNGEEGFSPLSGKSHTPFQMRNGELVNGTLEQKKLDSNGNENLLVSHEGLSPGSIHHPSLVNLVTWSQEDIYLYYSGHGVSANHSSGAEASKLLSNLSGDYDNQLNSLQYGRWWFDYVQNGSLPPISSPVLSQFQSTNSWDLVRRAMPFRRNMISPMNANGVVPRQVFFQMNAPIVAGTGFGMEEMPKPRGTGTYFPNANHYRDRPFSPRARNQHLARSPRNNGRVMTHADTNCLERNNREPQFYAHQVGRKNGSSDLNQSGSPEKTGFPNANGSMHLPHRVVEFGSMGCLASGPSSPESSKQQTLGVGFHSPRSQSTKPIMGMHQDRVAALSYHLKDEDDFPPLSI